MIKNMKQIKDWGLGLKTPLLIAGPCSAETEEQVLTTGREIAKAGKAQVFRAGIWKPRTRPGLFEGIGEVGLEWMAKVKQETGLLLTTEVATAEHVELALKHGVDILWVGARTTVNPFSVQEIADALKGVNIPVMVKNPINPDLALWVGAMERLAGAGIDRIAAIHRGFSSYEKTPFRNAPLWEMAIELKTQYPNLDIICDPSHIAGTRELIPYVAQKALDLDMAGLMIESHVTPSVAWSDAKQQVTPDRLNELYSALTFRKPNSDNAEFGNKLEALRGEIDRLDDEIFHSIATRMNVTQQIGEYKKQNGVTILQVGRWEEIVNKRVALGKAMGLSEEFLKKSLELLHKESIRRQNLVMNDKPEVSAK
ncbi:MAG: chorismate mutase [Bacteroidetes bacterium]|nr:chorismate mutase [Bacteroidota bacterium]